MTRADKFRQIVSRCRSHVTDPSMLSNILIVEAIQSLQDDEWIEGMTCRMSPECQMYASICKEFEWEVTNGEIFNFLALGVIGTDTPMEVYRLIRCRLNKLDLVDA